MRDTTFSMPFDGFYFLGLVVFMVYLSVVIDWLWILFSLFSDIYDNLSGRFNVLSTKGYLCFICWLPFLGMQSFNFCMVLTDLLFSLFSKYYLLLLWRTPSWGREVLIIFSSCTFYGDSTIGWVFSFEVNLSIHGCLSIYLTPILWRESFCRLCKTKSLNYSETGIA